MIIPADPEIVPCSTNDEVVEVNEEELPRSSSDETNQNQPIRTELESTASSEPPSNKWKTPIRDETVIVLNKQQIFNEILVFVSTLFLLFAQRPIFENSRNSRLEKNESKNFFFQNF